MPEVLSTYRLQLRPPAPDGSHPGCTFDDAAALVPHLADLGVSHLYCSPYLQAAPGSAHGYDVVDHSRVNAELGGGDGHARLVAACREAGLGMVLDIVPNHMSVAEPESLNSRWWALLRDGPDSEAGGWFDVETCLGGTADVLVPVLGDPLGDCLARGEITVRRDPDLGRVVRYFDHVLPVHGGTDASDDDVQGVLDAQHYRLCHWRLASEELNYRRFFDVTTLAGIRVEDDEVFDASHAVVVQQVRDGVLDGLRVDHPDGLADPEGYLERLAEQTDGTWVVVEKILEAHVPRPEAEHGPAGTGGGGGEELPSTWRTAGTTGYDTLNRLTGLLVDPAGEEPLTRLYGEVTGEETSWPAVVDRAKLQVLSDVLSAEVGRLTDLLATVARGDVVLRDSSRRALRQALVALLAEMPVYRAYVRPGHPVPQESRRLLQAAVDAAVARVPHVGRELRLLAPMLLDEGLPHPADGVDGEVGAGFLEELVVRFQQVCGPVMAKGVEDTAFYRYLRLTALNEVGGDPGRFGVDVATWHEACAAAQRDWPRAMTTLSTHDTKRTEDVRARLAVLSEVPQQWGDAVVRWSAAAQRYRAESPAGPVPSRLDTYLLWQTLVGAWPISADRAVAYALKAAREAKLRTAWVDGDDAYDAGLETFVRALLADEGLVAGVERFVTDVVAEPGRSNALAQKLLQLTAPGVPDVYQGTEVEDLSLVDPDNRRPVDWDRRRELAGHAGRWADDERLRDGGGLTRTRLVREALRLRRERPDLLGPDASYRALDVQGPAADHVVASLRGAEAGGAVSVAVRLPVGLAARAGGGDVGAGLAGTRVPLPSVGWWEDRVSGSSVLVEGEASVSAAWALGEQPVALLVQTQGPSR